MKITCWKIITITWSPRDLLLPFVPMFPPFYSSHTPTKLMYKLVFLACEEEFVGIICANNFTSWIGACITLWVHLLAYVPCIISLWVHFLAYIPCSMSLWVYFLAYAPCSKGEHVNNIWVSPYVLKGIPIWLFFICLILLSLIFNSKGLTFFCLRKNQLGSCSNSPFGLLSWILKLPTSEGAHVQTKLGFHHYVPKENSIQLQFAWFLSPTLISKEGSTFFSYKRPIWVTTFFFWSISNLKFLVWPCWVKTHKKPYRVLDVKHI